MKPNISIVTVCKNRLHHLKVTLPEMCKQSHSEVIVVDYGCEQGTSAWVNKNHPTVKVLQVKNTTLFNLSHARNIGAAKANGRFILFIDADIILKDDLGMWIQNNAVTNEYYARKESDIYGTVILEKSNYLKINGYDEAFIGWGGEDNDLYYRLNMIGLKENIYPSNYTEGIEHGDEERFFYEFPQHMGKREYAVRVNFPYMQIKYDLMALNKSMPTIETRKQIFEKVKENFKQNNLQNNIEIVSEIKLPGQILKRKMVYTIQ